MNFREVPLLRSIVVLLGAGLLVSACSSATENAAVQEPTPATASAEPSFATLPPLTDQSQQQAVQSRQNQMDEWITGVIGTSLDQPPENFSGVWLDPVAGTVTFSFKGSPSAQVARELGSPPSTFNVTVNSTALYSLVEMQQAITELFASKNALTSTTQWDISSAAPTPTGSGLTVGIYPKATGTQLAATDLRAAQSQIQAALSLTIQTREEGPSQGVAGGRWYDQYPWTNGAALATPGGGICSSGWAGQGSGGETVMLSANHCGNTKGSTYYTKNGANWNNGPTLGTVFGSIPDRDSVLIGTNGTGNAWIYDNAWNASQYDADPTYSVQDNYVGDLVCTTGAMSGAHCNLQITQTGVSISVDGVPASDMVKIHMYDSGVFTHGDSGGPVMALFGGTTNWRYGRGIISAVPNDAGTVSCGTPPLSTGQCYTDGYYSPLLRNLNEYNMLLYVVAHSSRPAWARKFVTDSPAKTGPGTTPSASPTDHPANIKTPQPTRDTANPEPADTAAPSPTQITPTRDPAQ
ncbi:MAG: hypothetical protein Q8P61_05685 [Candidatus Nanopelagicales bacterium]|nr:hypothetical protein [Candidatus Nanopelagicales bacterium]